jgi:hypothetical protein
MARTDRDCFNSVIVPVCGIAKICIEFDKGRIIIRYELVKEFIKTAPPIPATFNLIVTHYASRLIRERPDLSGLSLIV